MENAKRSFTLNVGAKFLEAANQAANAQGTSLDKLVMAYIEDLASLSSDASSILDDFRESRGDTLIVGGGNITRFRAQLYRY